MTFMERLLRFAFPQVRRVFEENERLRKENNALRPQIQAQLREFAPGSNPIVKLNAKVEALQLERDELYRQYNQLLERLPHASTAEVTLSDSRLEDQDWTKVQLGGGLRLNVGSGRVKKPGYLNVDVDPSVRPDVVLTLDSPLPFAAASFESVEAYHVIEHVYPWQALDLLTEFHRILKPGGKIVLECPNIESACGWLVQNAEYGWDSRMGMWALYGDPNPRNHLFMHRWGYTAPTLREILQKAGFSSIRRESPQTHVPKRDLRMVGVKTAE
jgi:predicted SAM-dependent methyltransferase